VRTLFSFVHYRPESSARRLGAFYDETIGSTAWGAVGVSSRKKKVSFFSPGHFKMKIKNLIAE
jgi:hypothetical protein